MRTQRVYDTHDGEPCIGCRAYGDYRGYHIEKTVFVNAKAFAVEAGSLVAMATGRYMAETRNIDRKLDGTA